MLKRLKFLALLGCAALLLPAWSARTVYVARHGQVGDKKFYDSAVKEPKLTPLGIEQAQMLANFLVKQKNFNGKILVSPIYRTIETGTYVAALLDNRPVILEPGIQEIARKKTHPGMTLAQINERFAGKTLPGSAFKDLWRLSFESDDARQLRVNAALERILKEHDGDLLLVTHGAVVGNLRRALEARKVPGAKLARGSAWNCSLHIYELDDNDRVKSSAYTTEYMPDAKVTSNFRTPKIPRPDDPRYGEKVKKSPKRKKTPPAVSQRQPGERLVLITRHCQQTGGSSDPSCIRPIPDDAGISPLGIKQAKNLGKELKRLNFKGKIYTSPYFRCVATGSYAAQECGSTVYPDARIQQRSRRKGGNLKNGGATLAQLRKLFPAQIAPDAVLADDWMNKNAETMPGQRARIKVALEQILAENPGMDILIVSHGSAVPEYGFNLTGKKPKGFVWNCALFKFAINKKGKVRYLGYDISFMPENEVTSNLKHSLVKEKAGVKAVEKSGVDYEF
ncbi:MAG: histidine phosphatase family protein [Lentisphaerae bacterium]|nr:histidine phosphatase family protein [Lentisphaerota bacterium]